MSRACVHAIAPVSKAMHKLGGMNESHLTPSLVDTRPPISAYIRTCDEQRRIEQVIQAAFTLAREVIIVDSGSTDATIEKATRLGAKVYHQDWLGNGTQKRVGESLATYDWLLDLDADEVLTPAFTREVQALFKNGPPPAGVCFTPLILVPPVGKPWYDFARAKRYKLYNRTIIRIPDHPAWDQFTIPRTLRPVCLSSGILHYASDSAALFITKVNKNSSTRARVLKPKPLVVLRMRIILGLPLYFVKRYVLQGMWRGGVYGFAQALMSGFGKWLRDVKMYENIRQKRGDTLHHTQNDQSAHEVDVQKQ